MFPSWWPDKGTLVVIDLGIDESAPHDKKLLLVSALVGQTSKMRKLAREWAKDLAANKVDFFHAKDYWNMRYKPYHKLSVTKRKKLLTALVGHVHKYARGGFSVCIDVEEFEKLADPKFRSEWGSAYAFAIQLLMILIHIDARTRNAVHEKANVLVEKGHKNGKQAIEILSKAIGSNEAFVRINTCAFGEKIGNPILQAADLVAYGSCQAALGGDSPLFAKLTLRSPLPIVMLPWNASVMTALKSDIETFVAKRKQRIQDLKTSSSPDTIGS